MTDKDNIISLTERLKEKRDREDKAGAERAKGARPGAGPESGAAGALPPIPAKLTWLHCRSCGTLEYTEVEMEGGRIHQACGKMVDEAVLEIDVRAEHTIAELNLLRLESLGELLRIEVRRYEEYQERLAAMAGEKPASYPVNEENLRRLPIAEVAPLGLLVSKAMHDPAALFPSAGESDAAGRPSPESSAGPPAESPGEAAPDSTDEPAAEPPAEPSGEPGKS